MIERRICSHCVMDETAPDIRFDDAGRCQYCRDFEALLATQPGPEERARRLDALIAEIKRKGRRRRYDCIVGVSGGADSSFALYQAVKHGLRPLAVHLDNGWNSELAVHNIAALVKRLDVPLITHVIRWEENRDLQRAFMAAHVIDIEMLMDSAMLEVNFAAARRFGVKFILSGSNSATEGMVMPAGWNHHKWDAANARSIHRRFGTRCVSTHPFYSLWKMLADQKLRRIRWVNFLDLFDYRKAEAIALLEREIGYKPYPHKHYESVFTRFYQGEILPVKFGVDKRRLHLSALIVSGQMSREDALATLEQHPYPDPAQLRDDREFVGKKLGYSEDELAAYLGAPPDAHAQFPSDEVWLRRLGKVRNFLRTAIGR